MGIQILSNLVFIVALLIGSSAFATNPPPATANADDAQQPGWLGIWVRDLPAELKTQLEPMIEFDEGLLVTHVEKDSPADQSGIQRHDVLLSFEGQKLYSPAQLSSLVQNFNANSQVQLVVIQHGQLKTLNARLSSERKRLLARTRRPPAAYPPMPYYRQPPPPTTFSSGADASVWDQFETLEVKTLPDGRYRATVSFKDASDEIKTFTFEGQKSDIIQKIRQLKDLPDDKRGALLKALNFRPDGIAGMRDVDRLTRELFPSPYFRRSPFNRPLFDDPFLNDPFFSERYYSQPWAQPPAYPPWQFHLYPIPPGPGQFQRP